MSDLEILLRRTLSDAAGQAPSAAGLVDDVRTRLEARAQPWRGPLLAVAAAVVLIAAVAAAVLVGRAPQPVPARPVDVSTTAVTTTGPSRLPSTAPSPVATTIYGTSGSAVTSSIVTGPLPTDPVTVTVTGAP